MGDYNVDLLKCPKCSRSAEFVQTAVAYPFFPMVSNPTQLATRSISLIDNMLTNCISVLDSSDANIINSSISDHFMIHHTLPGMNHSSCMAEVEYPADIKSTSRTSAILLMN